MTHQRDDLTRKLTTRRDEVVDADDLEASAEDESVEGHAVNFRPLDNSTRRVRGD